MSIEKIEMYSAQCDSCKDDYELWDGCVALNEKSAIEDDIKDVGEWVILENGKTYCSDCHNSIWNDELDQKEAYSKDTENSGAVFLGIIK